MTVEENESIIREKFNKGGIIVRIINLKAENVKRIKAIDITPKNDMVIISGNNGAGKTSVLDSIWYALQGRTGLKGTPEPIKKGEKRASVTLTLEDFIVTRNFTSNDKSYLKVTNREGLVYGSPQELLDSFIGELTFDPLEFAQMKDKDQRQLLLKLANVDIDSLDVKIDELKEERRLQGQTVKLYEGERDLRDFSEIPTEEISIEKLQKNVEKAIELNRNIDDSKQKVDRLETTILSWEAHIESLKEEIQTIKADIQKAKEEENFELKYLENATIINVEGMRNKLNKALEINELVQAKNRNILSDKKRKQAQGIYDNFTARIGEVTAQKVKALEKAKMPIEGLSVNDTGVIYNDIPFSQLSSSEQLKVSLCIAMALNPKLRVIRITNGSLLDKESMNTIKKYAKKEKYQIWVEKVDGSGTVGFYIEEGSLKNAH